jgi:MFS family permease
VEFFFGELFDKFGARIPLTIGMIATTVGLLLTAQSTKLVHFIFSFSILTAIGTSLAMAPLIGALSHWFLKKRALACSIGTIGGLVGGTVFPVMLQNLYDKVGFIWGIRILALICMFCMSVSIALVRERDQKHNASEISSPEVESLTNQETENLSYHENEVSSRKNPFTSLVMFLKGALDFSVLKDSRFICLTLAIWLAEVISMTTLTYLSSYALSNGLENSQAYLLITIVNVCGIPSRFISGLFADHYGRFNVMIVTSVMTTVVIFAVWLPAKGNLNILYAFAVLFGISTSAVISLIPACTGQICSVDNFGKVYGTVYFFLAFLTILGMYIASLVISGGSTTNYRNFVLYEGGLGAASIVLWIYARYTAVGWKWCKF